MSRHPHATPARALCSPPTSPSAGGRGGSSAGRSSAGPDAPVASALADTLALDAALALPDLMFLYFDKMSMAASLEVRVPFLDPDLVRFCTDLPDSRKVWLGRRKELLKRASRGLVDEEIINKRKRGFFHSALGAWLRVHRDTLLSDTLLDPRALARGQYDPAAVRTPSQPPGSRRQEERPAAPVPHAAGRVGSSCSSMAMARRSTRRRSWHLPRSP